MSGKLNEEGGPMRLDTDQAPLTFKPFEESRKYMFWGPNQPVDDNNPETYYPPSGFKQRSPLVIPRVARFLAVDWVSSQWTGSHLDPSNNTINTYFPSAEIFDTIWPSVRNALSARYADKYFYAQKYRRQCVLDGVAPAKGKESEKWFGTNMLNIVIVSEPLGYLNPAVNQYSLIWPPPGWTEAESRIVPYLKRWPKFKTIFYVDRASLQYVMEHTFIPEDNVSTPPVPQRPSDSDVLAMLDYTTTQLQNYCAANSEWAEYGGTLTSQVEANYFFGLLDAHLKYTQ